MAADPVFFDIIRSHRRRFDIKTEIEEAFHKRKSLFLVFIRNRKQNTAMVLDRIVILIVRVVAYSILIELCVRRVFFPLALVNVVSDGTRGPGIRYVKRFGAVYLRMILMISSFYVAGALSSTEIKVYLESVTEGDLVMLFNSYNGFVFLAKVIIYDVTALMFTKRASELANEALGC